MLKPQRGPVRPSGMPCPSRLGAHVRWATPVFRLLTRVLPGVLLLAVMFREARAQTAEPPTTPRPTIATTLDGRSLTIETIEGTITRAMAAARVTGLAVAIINNSSVVYQHAFGLRNAVTRESLTVTSTMYAASFTKAMFAHLVMQLVERRTLDLDRPIVDYTGPLDTVARWSDLTSDPRHALITTRMLLSHTAGFSNFRFLNPGEKLLINFEPGTRYAYSGEGLNLLQYVIETITRQSLDTLMRDRVFRPFGMRRTSMIWDESFASNLAMGHDSVGTVLEHPRRLAPRAAGSAETEIGDVAKFLVAVLRGDGLHPGSRRTMLTSKVRIRSRHQFPTLDTVTTSRDDAIRLSYGLGWGLFNSPYGPAFFKDGRDDGTRNYMVGFDRSKSGIVLMSNSQNADRIYPELVAILLGDRASPWQWSGLTPFADTLPTALPPVPPTSR
jgi:CubicO group peptidase (beta-lactamase class C family)